MPLPRWKHWILRLSRRLSDRDRRQRQRLSESRLRSRSWLLASAVLWSGWRRPLPSNDARSFAQTPKSETFLQLLEVFWFDPVMLQHRGVQRSAAPHDRSRDIFVSVVLRLANPEPVCF